MTGSGTREETQHTVSCQRSGTPHPVKADQRAAAKDPRIRNLEFSDLNGKREGVYVHTVLYVRYVFIVLYVLTVFCVLCIFYTGRTMTSFPVKTEPDHDHPLPGHRPPH